MREHEVEKGLLLAVKWVLITTLAWRGPLLAA